MPYVAVKPTSNSITGENNNVAICCVREAQSSVSYRVSTENYPARTSPPVSSATTVRVPSELFAMVKQRD